MLQDLDYFTGEERLRETLFALPNVRALTGTRIEQLLTAEGSLCGVVVSDRKTGARKEIACDGLFVAIGLIPENEPFKDLCDLNSYGYFDTDEQCHTKTPGIFVAGDCRSKKLRQVATACADGANAVTSVQDYLIRH